MTAIRNATSTAACLVGLALILAPVPATADFVILDDLIVDGSACVGFDCVNGESFGFDTIRLKENNLRIHFWDTSSAASYPTNDWRIVINDSANGGASYFAVEDTSGNRTPFKIEANARTNSLYIDDGGRLGLRTSTPSTEIHTIDGDTPTLRLQQDGSSGFAPQTWDVAGNETNFFIRDVTNGSQLSLRIRPDAPTSSLDIASDGDVGLGTSSPEQAVHVLRSNDSATNIRVENSNATAQSVNLQLENAEGRWDFRNNTSGNFQITLGGSGITELEIDNGNGDVTLGADLITGGSGTCAPPSPPCDGVFQPEVYSVESIEESAAYMWRNEHLRGIGPTPVGRPINVPRKTTGIIHELEKAHIYIEQLHERLARVEEMLAAAQAESND